MAGLMAGKTYYKQLILLCFLHNQAFKYNYLAGLMAGIAKHIAKTPQAPT